MRSATDFSNLVVSLLTQGAADQDLMKIEFGDGSKGRGYFKFAYFA